MTCMNKGKGRIPESESGICKSESIGQLNVQIIDRRTFLECSGVLQMHDIRLQKALLPQSVYVGVAVEPRLVPNSED